MNYVLDLQDIDKTKTMAVGGKAANLGGELFKIEEVRVPDGFCVSTEAFKEVMGGEHHPLANYLTSYPFEGGRTG